MKPEAQYFYIITFDSQIFELKYTEQKLNSAVESWKNGGLLVFQEVGGGIHANSISKILSEELYDSYTTSVKPKLYIKDGTWYDGQERKMVRREQWKQEELDNRSKIESEDSPIELTPEQKIERRKIIDKMTEDMKTEKYILIF